MRLEFGALPWELLGRRPVMVTLTYPGEWERCVPNARVLVKHREAFKERWRRKYGPPIGVWVVEFQRRGAPHLHLYLGLPHKVSEEEFIGLQKRTIQRRRLQRQVGPYEARRQMRAPGGEFAMWIRTAWWEIVGSQLKAHHGRGVDLAVMFYSDRAEAEADRTRVAEYLWRESGKWAQKQPPEDFGSLRFYGRWGDKQGFRPVISEQAVPESAAYELRRVLRHLQAMKMREDAQRGGYRLRPGAGGTRGRDGLTVFGIDGQVWGPRLVEWAEHTAVWKQAQAGDTERQIVWQGRATMRAFPEIDRAETEAVLPPRDPEDEYERWLAEQAEQEAALEAMIDDYLAGRLDDC